jgi:hypothetical protein
MSTPTKIVAPFFDTEVWLVGTRAEKAPYELIGTEPTLVRAVSRAQSLMDVGWSVVTFLKPTCEMRPATP